MSPERSQHLLDLVRPHIQKEDTKFQKAISAAERLAITLRFLATGDSQKTLSFSFRVGKARVSKIVAETSDAIYSVLKETYHHQKQKKTGLGLPKSSKTSGICHTQLDALMGNMFESSAQSFLGLYIIIIRGLQRGINGCLQCKLLLFID